MTNLIKLILLVIPFLASAANACYSTNGEIIELIGKPIMKIFPGPPNYTNISNGDMPEKSWYLILEKPTCFLPDGVFQDQKITAQNIQLVSNTILKIKAGLKYKVVGDAFHAHTGHHHAKVLLQVKSVSK